MAVLIPFDSSRNISSGLALLVIIILSMGVAWMTMDASAKIVRHAKDMSRTSLDNQSVPAAVKAGR